MIIDADQMIDADRTIKRATTIDLMIDADQMIDIDRTIKRATTVDLIDVIDRSHNENNFIHKRSRMMYNDA